MPMTNSDKQGAPAEKMGELGSKLRSLREAQSLTYDDVTEAIHVRPFILRAIEEGRVLEVAEPVYARGFVKNYCEYLCADDLWGKYKTFFDTSSVAIPVRARNLSPSAGIKHPTPIFRRSSMFWVYLVLVLAVAGAAYLLWWQQKEGNSGGFAGFFFKSDDAVATNPPNGAGGGLASGDLTISVDLPVAIYLMSRDQTPTVTHPSSRDAAPGAPDASVDLSWMDGGAASNLSTSSAESTAEIARDNTGNELFIQITGARCRLEVLRSGVILTARTLARGDVRSYDITADTDVRFSIGNAARVAWRGSTYEGIGADNAPVSFRFTPSGEMKLTKGKSQHTQ